MSNQVTTGRRGSASDGLHATLLGPPALAIDGHAIAPQLGAKPRGLIYYLIAEAPKPLSRTRAAAMFWGEDDSSRVSVRQAVARLRRCIGDTIISDADGLSLNPATPLSCDLHRLQSAACDLETMHSDVLVDACSLYSGEFLEGLDLRATNTFEQWLRTTRERVRRQALTLCEGVIVRLVAEGLSERAINVAYRWVEIDEADENAHATLMRLLAAAGRRTAAIAQYESCRRILRDVLGARPSSATFALYTQIHADTLPGRSVANMSTTKTDSPIVESMDQAEGAGASVAHKTSAEQTSEIHESDSLVVSIAQSENAPVAEPSTSVTTTHIITFDEGPLFGRDQELEQLRMRLDDPDCRLLTLLGPGGVGKTRLALALAQSMRDCFADGQILVRGAEIQASSDESSALVEAIALQCGCRLDGALDPARALAHMLSDRCMLIVLDNLESIPDAGYLIKLLLGGTRGVRVLATSQQRVGSGREWLFELHGLALEHAPGRLSAAAELFTHEARRLRHDFDALEEQLELESVCAWLEGVPLALQMAAQGIRQGNCEMLLERLKRDAALFDYDRAETDRHRSMQSVIDDAWQRLEPHLQVVLLRLARLPAAFIREQAFNIAKATDDSIDQLADRCWLRIDRDGLVRLHGLHRLALCRLNPLIPSTERSQATALANWWIDALTSESLASQSTPESVLARLALAQMQDIFDRLAEAKDHPRLEALLVAAPKLLNDVGAWREAAKLLECGSRVVSVPVDIRGLWLMRAALLHNLAGDVVNTWELVPAAIELLELDGDSAVSYWQTVRALRRHEHLAAQLLSDHPARQDILLGLMSLCQMRAFVGDSLGSARIMLILRKISHVYKDWSGRALCDSTICYLCSDYGHPPGTRLLAKRAAKRAPRADTDLAAAVATLTRAAALYSAGRWHETLALLEPLVANLDSFTAWRWAFEARSLVAKVFYSQGRIVESEQRFSELFELVSARGHRSGLIWAGVGQAETALRTGAIVPAKLVELLEKIEMDIHEIQITDPAYTIRHLGARSTALARLGEWHNARQVALSGVAAMRRINRCGSWAHEGFGNLMETLLGCAEQDTWRGDDALRASIDEARRCMRKHCRIFPPGRARYQLCLCTLYRLQNRTTRAERALAHAITIASRFDMRLDLARVYEARARLALSESTGNHSQPQLERAVQAYRACGAHAEIARIELQAC